MKFYVVLLVTYLDGSNDKVGIYSMASSDSAIKSLHSYAGQYIDAENVATVFVEARNNVGGNYGEVVWVKEVAPEPTPEVEA